jgi:IclR helix-turn-helix domain.
VATRWEITKAVRASDLPSPSRLIMLVLADVAEVGTAEIPERFTPSVRVLERETGLSRSAVQRHLASLEDGGWITRTRPATSEAMWNGERVRYHLALPAGVVAEVDEGGSSGTPGVVADVHEGGSSGTPLETDLSDQVKTSLPRKRGRRIPDDFAISPAMREWAMANVPQLAGSRETEKFINYWRAKAGAGGVKLDWDRTWRNWMLNAVDRLGARASPSTAPEKIPRAERCPDHPNQRAVDCGGCRALANARPRRTA